MNASNTRANEVELATAIGVFPGYAETRRAVEALRDAGFRNDQIGVIGPGDRGDIPERSGLPNDPTYTQWEQGAGIGAAAGGLASGLTLVASGVCVLPSSGPIGAGAWGGGWLRLQAIAISTSRVAMVLIRPH